MNDHRLAKQLIQDENILLHAYQDSKGFWTIGVGRLIDKRKGGGITEDEALYLLGNDIKRHWGELVHALPWIIHAPDEVQEVLANMAFNLGVPGLLKFKLTIGHLQAGRYREASEEMMRSDWAQQVGQRAVRLSARIAVLEHRGE